MDRRIEDVAEGEDRRPSAVEEKARMVEGLRALSFSNGRPVLTDRQYDALWRIYVRGISVRECARQDGCTRRTIQKAYQGAWDALKRYQEQKS